MKIDTDDFRVRHGAKVNLGKRPTRCGRYYESEGHYERTLADQVERLRKVQPKLYAHNRYALLIIFQAMDAAGKDGVIKHVMSGVNPQGCQVHSFKHPSEEVLDHDFLWHASRRFPERGRIGIFNRSYYEEVLIVRVHKNILDAELLPDEHAQRRLAVARSLPLDTRHRAPPARQRHARGEVLPARIEGRAVPAVPRAARRAGQELEARRRQTSKSASTGTTT